MPSRSKEGGAGPAPPDQPIQMLRRSASTGCSAVTRPPGLRRQVRPSSVWTVSSAAPPVTSSTGSRFATTTKEPWLLAACEGAEGLATDPPFGRCSDDGKTNRIRLKGRQGGGH